MMKLTWCQQQSDNREGTARAPAWTDKGNYTQGFTVSDNEGMRSYFYDVELSPADIRELYTELLRRERRIDVRAVVAEALREVAA